MSGIPCVILFKNGQEIDRFVGLKQKDDIEQWLSSKNIEIEWLMNLCLLL